MILSAAYAAPKDILAESGMCFYLVSLRHKKEYKAIREKVMYGE